MLLECRCCWNNTSGIGVWRCTHWWQWFRLHSNWGLFYFYGLISVQLVHQRSIRENRRESEIWTVREECLLQPHYQTDHPSWRFRRLWVGGILMREAILLLFMPLYRDDLGNGWMHVLLKSDWSEIICRIHLCFLDIWDHELRPCNVKNVEYCCMRQEMWVQGKFQGECR